jgi:hypothetical protein
MLHFVYYNCAISIHRVSVHHGGWIATDDEAEIEPSPLQFSSPASSHGFSNPRVYASYALCLSAARSIIHLATQFLDARDDPLTRLIWVAIYFPITACFTLFTHTLQSPFDPRVENDLELMERTLIYVSQSQLMRTKSPAGLTLDVFGDLVTVGREYVNKVRSRSLNADAAPHESQNGLFAPEPPSSQGISLANIESSDIHPSRPFYSATLSSSMSALLSAHSTMDDAMANAPPSNEFSYAFNFVPFDMTDLDPTFQFAFEGNQYQFDLPNIMGDDAEFMGVDDLKAGQASYVRYQ